MRLFRRHRHEWDVTAVNHYERKYWHFETGEERSTGRTTKVLKVCITCGKRDVENLDGQWSLEQVRGLMAPSRSGVSSG